MRSNSPWFKSYSKSKPFTVVTGLGICKCLIQVSAFSQSYFRNKSLSTSFCDFLVSVTPHLVPSVAWVKRSLSVSKQLSPLFACSNSSLYTSMLLLSLFQKGLCTGGHLHWTSNGSGESLAPQRTCQFKIPRYTWRV